MVKLSILSETRIKILRLLLIEDSWPSKISRQLRIKEFAVRRHLDLLEKEGLVTFSIKKTGEVGHPLKVYTLTSAGRRLEIFPRQHEKVLSLIIENIMRRYGRDIVASILSDVARDIAKQFSTAIKGEDIESMCEDLTKAMENFGKCSCFKREGECYAIYVYNCVFNELAKTHQDLICNFMDQAIVNALGGEVSVTREICIAKGDRLCKRLIKPISLDFNQRDKL